MKAFTIEEMENIFEIGRTFQCAADEGAIEIKDSKEAFAFALKLAIDFEKEHPDSDDYYYDIDDFCTEKILKEFGEYN